MQQIEFVGNVYGHGISLSVGRWLFECYDHGVSKKFQSGSVPIPPFNKDLITERRARKTDRLGDKASDHHTWAIFRVGILNAHGVLFLVVELTSSRRRVTL